MDGLEILKFMRLLQGFFFSQFFGGFENAMCVIFKCFLIFLNFLISHVTKAAHFKPQRQQTFLKKCKSSKFQNNFYCLTANKSNRQTINYPKTLKFHDVNFKNTRQLQASALQIPTNSINWILLHKYFAGCVKLNNIKFLL